MNYSASNTSLWGGILQISIICVVILFAHFIKRVFPFIKKVRMPTAVLAGFILLVVKIILKQFSITFLNMDFMELLTYHGIAIGFIAMSLRVPEIIAEKSQKLVGLKSGAVIVGSYMIQGVIGLIISLVLSYTFMPGLFKAAGILLPLGYGQGPGQANNTGSSYEALGFVGGRSFGLAIAAAGYISACVVGVIYINYLVKKKKISIKEHDDISGSVTVDYFQNKNELPISESLDKFSIQLALVLLVYTVTFLTTWGLTSLLSAISESLGNSLNSLLWGFNFMIGSGMAILFRSLLSLLYKKGIVKHQYQNNYLLNRIAGLAFDVMIVAGIASIEIAELAELWIPFIIMSVAGAIVTLIHLKIVCKNVYEGYYYEGLLSMYGMMTGTISSGIILLREIDPQMKTPAANNLVIGSSFAILFGAPLLILVSLAPQKVYLTFVTLGLLVLYYLLLVLIAVHRKKTKKKEVNAESEYENKDS